MKKRANRSPATLPGYRKGISPKSKGQIYPPQAFNDDDFVTLMTGCSRTSNTGARDRAVMCVMYRSGVRISEALSLQISDLRPDEHAILVRRGKGGKSRTAYMDDYGWEHLNVWLERRGKLVDETSGWVFCTIAQPTPGGRLGSPQVRTMMKRKGQQAGLKRRCNPHALRHGFAVGLLKSNSTIAEICELMGHSNMATTSIYLRHVDPTSKVAAVGRRPRPGGPVETDQEAWEKQARAAGWERPTADPEFDDAEQDCSAGPDHITGTAHQEDEAA
jgi:site-specific recombinase XerD